MYHLEDLLAVDSTKEIKIDSRLALHIEDVFAHANFSGSFEVPVRTGVLCIQIVPFGPLPNPRNYTPLLINCNISSTTLGEAARILGPAFVYDLYVNPYLLIDTRSVLHRLALDIDAFGNPLLAPHVNLRTDSTLESHEWYLAANGKGCGSKGV